MARQDDFIDIVQDVMEDVEAMMDSLQNQLDGLKAIEEFDRSGEMKKAIDHGNKAWGHLQDVSFSLDQVIQEYDNPEMDEDD